MADEKKTEEEKKFSIELIDKFTQLITSGFGLVAALAWNDAIQTAFNRFFKGGQGLIAKSAYAFLVTIIIVIIVYQFSQLSNQVKNKLEKKQKNKNLSKR